MLKTRNDLIDNLDDEGQKVYKVIPTYLPLLIIFCLLIYSGLVWALTDNILISNDLIGNINYYFIIGSFVLSGYYFISILRINRLIKKYGLIKNK